MPGNRVIRREEIENARRFQRRFVQLLTAEFTGARPSLVAPNARKRFAMYRIGSRRWPSVATAVVARFAAPRLRIEQNCGDHRLHVPALPVSRNSLKLPLANTLPPAGHRRGWDCSSPGAG